MQDQFRPDRAAQNLSSPPMLGGRLLAQIKHPVIPEPPSPLMLSDRLLTLAQDAESAGCVSVAGRLLALAHIVLDPPEDVFSAIPR